MGAGVSDAVIRVHMRKAKQQADAYKEKFKVNCSPRLLRASNGECAIVYDVTTEQGTFTTTNLRGLND